MEFPKTFNFIFTLITSTFMLNATAIMKNDEKVGDVLLFPVFSTAENNDSLITIQNTDIRDAKALKIRFLDSTFGNELMSLNLYLGKRDSWVAALSEVEGQTIISTPDNSCTIPATGGNIPLSLAGLIGSIEVFEMGVIEVGDLNSQISAFDCSSLEDSWESGPWSTNPGFGMSQPTGGLRGTLSVINVEKGTLYSMDASALIDFSDIVQHSPWGSTLPDLSSAHDAGTQNGATKSRVCIDGVCIDDEWERPIDAVSAALIAHKLTADFIIDESINAKTEWVISYPTRKFYEPGDALFETSVSLLVTDREGGYRAQPCVPPYLDFICETSYLLSHSQSIEVLDFSHLVSEIGMPKTSPILGIEHTVLFPNDKPLFEAGNARVGFETHGRPTLTSKSGRQYFGAPSIGVSLQEFSNGTLQDALGNYVKASYGNAFPLTIQGGG